MKAPHEKWRCPGELRAANDDGKLGIGRLPNQGLGGCPSISLQEPDEIRSGRKQNQNATDDITPQATHMPPFGVVTHFQPQMPPLPGRQGQVWMRLSMAWASSGLPCR